MLLAFFIDVAMRTTGNKELQKNGVLYVPGTGPESYRDEPGHTCEQNTCNYFLP
jgi:hypothetical protein